MLLPKFAYAGVRYAHGANRLPGSGATRRYYAHVYFCEKCCQTKGQKAEGPDHSSYDRIAFEATPGSFDEVCVPDYDRRYGYY